MSSKHILLVGAPGWGHLRPLISLASKLVHQRSDVIVTYTITGGSKSMLENEIDRYFNNDEQALKDNIRLLHVGGLDIANPVQLFQVFIEGFAKIYPAIYTEEQLTCATGRVYPAVSRPDVILLDPFFYEMLETIRKISGNTIPVLAWNTAALYSTLRFFGPPLLGGMGNVSLQAEELVQKTGKPLNEILPSLYQLTAGEVIKLPGMPAMYDYEFNVQHLDPRLLVLQSSLYPKIFRFFKECDGMVALGNASFEPDACATCKAWFSPRPVYFIGPLLPGETSVGDQLSKSQEKELTGSSNGIEVKIFLDNIQKSHGDYSLLYMSFGSNFWPMGEGVWKVVEIVLEMKIPMILSHNPKKVEMPSHLQERLQTSEIALVSAWAPQHVILGHKATGWFLTHCGNNSVSEAVSYGVPMIAWPLAGDQPINAAYMSSTLNIAYELFETRMGDGLRRLYRGVKPEGSLEAIEKEIRSVLSNAWGPDGAQKRNNTYALQKKLNLVWGENGEARKEFLQFLDKFIPVN